MVAVVGSRMQPYLPHLMLGMGLTLCFYHHVTTKGPGDADHLWWASKCGWDGPQALITVDCVKALVRSTDKR